MNNPNYSTPDNVERRIRSTVPRRGLAGGQAPRDRREQARKRPTQARPPRAPRDIPPRARQSDPQDRPWWKSWWVKALSIMSVLAVLVGGVTLAFPTQVLGGAVRLVSSGPSPNIQDMADGVMPTTSTLRDSNGEVITYFYDQNRTILDSDDIAPVMKEAIVAIEDRRFYEHEGVDWLGVIRAAVTNTLEGGVRQGASTLTQQYVKNYSWLITASSEEEQSKAIAQTTDRKLTEITAAEDLTARTDKDTVLTNYLNLVTFGNGTYGIEAAARTYFGIPASDLDAGQAALLAGLVQAPTTYDPYVDPDAAVKRRNIVLDAMASYGAISQRDADLASAVPLGILESPARLPQGCSGAGNSGFFCDRVVKELAGQGITRDMLDTGGYDITSSLDPSAQESVIVSLHNNADPRAEGVAETMALIEPGADSRYIRAMGTSRIYGFDGDQRQSALPLADSLVGAGAGSVFKVFTAAAAIDAGLGLDSRLQVPVTYEATGLGEGGSADCAPGKYCVSNVGVYPETMSLTEAMAHSPNTPFIALAERVGNSTIVDTAVAMGLRSYEHSPDELTPSIADRMRGSGSFTLGPTQVNTVELANVAATIASNGVWCAPTVLQSANGPDGEINLARTACEDVIAPGTAANLANSLADDVTNGTAATAARNAGWSGPMAGKTGTTDDHRSASFLGFTTGLAGAVYAFNDGTDAMPLCTGPLRQCSDGNLFGGNEPAATWFNAVMPVLGSYGGPGLPLPTDGARQGVSERTVIGLAQGRTESAARRALAGAGFAVSEAVHVHHDEIGKDIVISAELGGMSMAGDPVKLIVSRGKKEEVKPTTSTRTSPRPTTSAPRTTDRAPSTGTTTARRIPPAAVEPSPAAPLPRAGLIGLYGTANQ